MSGPSEKAIKAACGHDLTSTETALVMTALREAHDPVLGFDRSVCLRDVMAEDIRRDPAPTIWVHGMPARDLDQVASYLCGDAHDRTKVQILVGGHFYTLADMCHD